MLSSFARSSRGHAVHLLIDEPHEVADVGLGEDVLPDLGDGQPLETLAFRRGVSQVPLPRFSRDWQT